ncbi:MAG TPA: type II toxin-antitoxin system RelE/ParE family toxin, partial [Pontimonas sp.]|nr:type II toxin-antitoxin system RelE/ParE family toxin [Pontimonas sp.]
MSLYSVVLTESARKSLKAIHTTDQKRLYGAIELLRTNPRPPAAKKLRNRDGFRVRVGDYRIVYEVSEQEILIVIFLTGHREDVH